MDKSRQEYGMFFVGKRKKRMMFLAALLDAIGGVIVRSRLHCLKD